MVCGVRYTLWSRSGSKKIESHHTKQSGPSERRSKSWDGVLCLVGLDLVLYRAKKAQSFLQGKNQVPPLKWPRRGSTFSVSLSRDARTNCMDATVFFLTVNSSHDKKHFYTTRTRFLSWENDCAHFLPLENLPFSCTRFWEPGSGLREHSILFEAPKRRPEAGAGAEKRCLLEKPESAGSPNRVGENGFCCSTKGPPSKPSDCPACLAQLRTTRVLPQSSLPFSTDECHEIFVATLQKFYSSRTLMTV